MAATYNPALPSGKDRVRLYIVDKAAPWRFQDEEIGATLTGYGYIGDPLASVQRQDVPEIRASIALLESQPILTGDERTIKQGSIQRTTKGGSGDYTSVLASLRRRLNLLLGNQTGGGGIAVVSPYYPEVDRRNGWPH